MENFKSQDTTVLTELLIDLDVDGLGSVGLPDVSESLFTDIKALLPSALSAIVFVQEIFPESVRHISSKAIIGDLALRDLFISNTAIASGHLNWEAFSLVRRLHKKGYKGLVLPAEGGPFSGKYLEGPVSYKKLAVATGLGMIGWNGLLLMPKFGPKVRLACVITDARVDTKVSTEEFVSPCIECGGACVKICPIKAISKPKDGELCQIDKYACNTYLIGSESCAECIKVCPGFKR